MSDTGMIAKYKQQWQEMDPKFKYAMMAIVVGGAILLVVKSKEHDQIVRDQEARSNAVAASKAGTQGGRSTTTGPTIFSALPTTGRNQGLEDLLASLDKARNEAREAQEHVKNVDDQMHRMNERLVQIETHGAGTLSNLPPPSDSAGSSKSSAAGYENLPPPVDFGQPGTGAKATAAEKNPFTDGAIPNESNAAKIVRTSMHEWPSEAREATSKQTKGEADPLAVPINSALESVMLTGINARSNSAGGAASGTILSANNVGAPFVSRIKGSAILPNGWRVSDFNDCFISGTGIAILSSERANVIANVMSCIDKRGNVYEAKIKAYGVDLDGIQGISGRVVTKQGSVLAKTALAGVASGLGSAFTPQNLPSYNQNAQSGDRQGYQLPNPSLIGGSALGGGINEAGKALAKFYLDYAKEMFPVIEVNAGTRITWIIQESFELTQVKKAK
jgi:conjugal transfer pilus assembly protein TraB